MIALPFSFCTHKQLALNIKNNNLDILSNLDPFLTLIPCESKLWYKRIWLHISGDSFHNCHDSLFSSKCRNNSEVNLPYQNKMSSHLLNGFSLLQMGWRARRAAGEGNALWCQWFVYLIRLQLILLYFSNNIYGFLLIIKRMYFCWEHAENLLPLFPTFTNLYTRIFLKYALLML